MTFLEGNKVKLLTNSFVVRDGKILLGMKKRGFGNGKYNGFGGKLEPEETPLQCAQREFQEEANIQMVNPKELGTVEYKYEPKEGDQNGVKELKVYIFMDTMYSGEIKETEEMRPQWFPIEDIPFHQMWADDTHWYPHLLQQQKFKGFFHFESDMKTLKSWKVEKL